MTEHGPFAFPLLSSPSVPYSMTLNHFLTVKQNKSIQIQDATAINELQNNRLSCLLKK